MRELAMVPATRFDSRSLDSGHEIKGGWPIHQRQVVRCPVRRYATHNTLTAAVEWLQTPDSRSKIRQVISVITFAANLAQAGEYPYRITISVNEHGLLASTLRSHRPALTAKLDGQQESLGIATSQQGAIE